MAPSQKMTGLRKRQQIAQANRMVFVWVAIASVVLSFAIIGGQFLVSKAIYNNKVLTEKKLTRSTLEKNIKAADKLKKEVAVLSDNQALRSARVNDDETTLQVIIDALPTKEDALALGSSLQLVILPKAGVIVESLTVGDTLAAVTEEEASTASAAATPITFTAIFTGNAQQIKAALLAIEKTIRPISIDNLTVEGADSNLKATISATTYYQQPKTLDMQSRVVEP